MMAGGSGAGQGCLDVLVVALHGCHWFQRGVSLPSRVVYFFHITGEKAKGAEHSVVKGSPCWISNQGM